MTEAELCAAFREAAESDGWLVYPEVAGWDLVLVWSGELSPPEWGPKLEAGDQVAIEAKLRANVTALRQAATRQSRGEGPNYRAVLAPKIGRDFAAVAGLLKLGTYSAAHYEHQQNKSRSPIVAPWHRYPVKKRLTLPPIVTTKEAGTPSPSALTPWRVKALRLMAVARRRDGRLTREDFKAAGVHYWLWLQQGWIRRNGYEFALNTEHPRLPDAGWEEERDRLAEDDDVDISEGT